MTKIFDTHAHYNLEPLAGVWKLRRSEALAAGVAHATVVGTNIATSQRAWQLRGEDPDFFRASIGLHPDVVDEPFYADDQAVDETTVDTQLARLTKLAATADFDAWGEMGLDFYRHDRRDNRFPRCRDLQLRLLREQLSLAATTTLPIILHVRDDEAFYDDPEGAYGLTLHLLHETGCAEKTLIFHCFSGSENYLRQALEYPHSYISFAGNLTFKSAHQLRALAKLVPPDRLLLETDCPFLSPEPVRGQPCQPAFIRHTADFAETQLGVDLAQVYQNSLAIFDKNEV